MDVFNPLKKTQFPADSETWDFLQSITKQVSKLALLGGENYILSGCEQNGSNVSDGWIIVNGEIMPFKGGTLQSTFIIDEINDGVTYENVNYPDLYVQRFARFGTGSNQHYFNTLEPVKDLTEVLNHINDTKNPHNVTVTQVGLDKVDNTNDYDKPISTLVHQELSKIKTDILNIKSELKKRPQIVAIWVYRNANNWLYGGFFKSMKRDSAGQFTVTLTQKIAPDDYLICINGFRGYGSAHFFEYSNSTSASPNSTDIIKVYTGDDASANDIPFQLIIMKMNWSPYL